MPNRLEPINLVDFTGGLNLRRNQFQLAPNESPEMINIAIDPLGGIYTRWGWERWNGPDIVPEGSPWDPRRAWVHTLADGTTLVYIAANNTVFWSQAPGGSGNVFTDLAIAVHAAPHMADWATFGDDLYIAGGKLQPLRRRTGIAAPVNLTFAGAGSWNDDYLNPLHMVGPRAEVIEAHSGYLFAANINEDGALLPNRLRWSHPTSQDDWAQLDFIDIEIGGSKITGLMSYEDHLLIFKNDSVWALYGYDQDSWQLVQKSSTVGAMSPQSISRNEQAVFFYSASDKGGIYAYGGERPVEIAEQLRHALERLLHPELIWVGWLGRRLWVTLPWNYSGPTEDNAASFVYDPTIGERGAWVYYTSEAGSIGPVVAGSGVDSMLRPLGVLRAADTRAVVRLDALDDATDQIWEYSVLGYVADTEQRSVTEDGYLVTGNDEEIIMGGAIGYEPFESVYRTGWITADWPTRKKSFRRPDLVCRYTGMEHQLQVRSYRDYEELNAKRQHNVLVPAGSIASSPPSNVPGQVRAVWNSFNWNDGTLWNQEGETPTVIAPQKQGASIRRGSSFGLCRALQLRIKGATPFAKWGVDAVIVKVVMRRFR
jgi:hypothetical protein